MNDHRIFLGHYLCLVLGIVFPLYIQAQSNNYAEMLRFSTHAALVGRGGQVISSVSPLAAMAASNPAQFNRTKQSSDLTLSHFFLAADISMSTLDFASTNKNHNVPFYVSVGSLSYGTFDSYDEREQLLEEGVSASDFSVQIGASYALYPHLRLGANLGVVASNYGSYSASAIHADIGAFYQRDSLDWSFGLVAQQIGGQLSNFYNSSDPLPFNLSFGASKRLKHLPLTINITYTSLHHWNLEFDNPFEEERFIFSGQEADEQRSTSFPNMFLRHLVLGGELDLGGRKSDFKLRFGYDFNKNQVASVPNLRTLSGLSLGFGFAIKTLKFDYAYTKDHYVSSSHHLSVGLRFCQLTKNGILNK